MTLQQMMEVAGLTEAPATDEELGDMLKKCMHSLSAILDDKPLTLLDYDT